jgi:inosine-uridine nucleoside N-ribohydrolase
VRWEWERKYKITVGNKINAMIKNSCKFLCVAAMIISIAACVNNSKNSPFKFDLKAPVKQVVVITDFGRDVDDAQALAWLAGCKNINIAGIIATGDIPAPRAVSAKLFLNLFGVSVPIAYPDSSNLAKQAEYLKQTALDGRAYELTLEHNLSQLAQSAIVVNSPYFMKIQTPSAMLDSICKKYPGEVTLLVLAPAQKLFKDSTNYNLKEIVVQGLISKMQTGESINDLLVPDYGSYNFRADSSAAEALLSLQNRTSFAFIGKGAAYSSPITPRLGRKLEKRGFAYPDKKLGEENLKAITNFIKQDREMGLRSFLARDKQTFYKIFNIKASVPIGKAIEKMKIYNYPYDLIAAIYVSNPEVFNPTEIKLAKQTHRVINSEKEFKDKKFLKYIIR